MIYCFFHISLDKCAVEAYTEITPQPQNGSQQEINGDMATQTMRVREAITAANNSFMQAFARGDAAGVAALYTSEGMAMAPGFEAFTGREQIQALWQGAMDMGLKGATLETVELDQVDDTAIEVGRYTLSGASGNLIDAGKYLVVWKEVDGRWLLHRDIWNTNQAAPDQ